VKEALGDHLNSIILNHRIEPELYNQRSYASTYRFTQNNLELFRVHLNKKNGFYLMSDFVGSNESDNFVMEQTNRMGTPNIEIYQKTTRNLLGVIQGNCLLDNTENLIAELQSAKSMAQDTLVRLTAQEGDVAVVTPADNKVVAVLSRLPRKQMHPTWLTKLTKWVRLAGGANHNAMEISVLQDKPLDLRLLLAAAVIAHSRGGLQV
jgi:hypothetical protein